MLIYQYSGGLDGFLSSVFRVYENRKIPDLITESELCQQPLDAELVRVFPEEDKALRVERGIGNRLGNEGIHQIAYAYASADPEKNTKLLYWILSVFKYGNEVQKRFQDPHIMEFCDMTSRVSLEVHRSLGFLRFKQSEEGIYVAEFSPDHNILPFLMPHFTHRMNDQQFLIRDRKRNLFGLYNGTEWKVLSSDADFQFRPSEPEETFCRLWKEYYHSVNIAARENRRLQDSYLPRRYRIFLTEFQN